MFHAEGRYAMVHAGLLPQWTTDRAAELGREVEQALASADYREFLAHMYGNQPKRWEDGLGGWDRLRVIVNVMTRMRFCTCEGDFELKSTGSRPPAGFLAWFDARPPLDEPTLICGHWSALGLKLSERTALLDSGCVWGGALSALRLEDRWLVQVPCAGYQPIGEAA
jgi:bis(5'-nucleosyl)-tetraphosphatase (symmetrical)